MRKGTKTPQRSGKRTVRRDGIASFKGAIRTKSGRYLLPSPVKSVRSRASWAKAFGVK
jgi:hypothetical protein